MKKIWKFILVFAVFTALSVFISASAFAAEVKTGTKSEVDVTDKDSGYIKVHSTVKSTKKLKVKTSITRADGTKVDYTYDLDKEGAWETFSLQSGDGKYTVQVLENIEGTRYSVIQTVTVDVKYTNKNAPFLVATQNVNYTSESAAVKKAEELCKDAKTELAKVENIYKYIVENIKYDYDKAKKVSSGEITQYLPVVDTTLSDAKGICFDYSSLFAAMLRSQGIPAKLIMGYVADTSGSVYHAWNEVYIEEVGWIKIRSSIYFDGVSWERTDSTFAAANQSGQKTSFISNDANYAKSKEY